MKPFFKPFDEKLFYKYLNKSTVYFEFGCGGSTYQACIKDNIKEVYSTESDLQWINQVKKNVNSNKLNFNYIDLQTVPNTWGNPGKNLPISQYKKYSDSILDYSGKNIDLILIDGRFRVACCLKCFEIIDSNCCILFNDFLVRLQYHIVLDYYKIIELTNDHNMVVLRKKHVDPPSSDIIQKYETICD